jgi:hypothetical protein
LRVASLVLRWRGMTRTTLLWAAVLVTASCGRDRGSGEGADCDPGQHLADPDGRGDRCIEDSSTCESATECPGDGACCEGACADAQGTGVYACVQSCRAPECTEGSCGAGFVCEAIGECIAHCVPDDVACDVGTVPADPSGNGVFQCIPSDSLCFAPADCASAELVDPCCPPVCLAGEDGRFACTTTCGGAAGAPEEDVAMPAPECTVDDDCVPMYGEGATCEADCGGWTWCQAPPDPCACARGAYVPVCGVDGVTYDSACGIECVPVDVACEGECPCPV